MNKFFMVVLAAGLMVGCSKDRLKVIHNNDRVSDLEQRMTLNEQLDASQSTLISINNSAISLIDSRVTVLENGLSQTQADLSAEIADRQAGEAYLQSLIAQEAAAREVGDQAQADALAQAIATQTAINNAQQAQINLLSAAAASQLIVNLAVQGQIASINSKFPIINNKLTSLQNQVNNINTDIDVLQSQVGGLLVEVSDLDLRMSSAEGDISSLQSQIDNLTSRLDAEGVKAYKCNMIGNNERFFKINGTYYAVMNHVTTGTSQIITAGTPQTVTTPKLCVNNGNNFKLPDSSGNCTGGGWSVLAGSGVTTTIPSYTTQNVTVVTGVQMALEPLVSGQTYTTTDGGVACTLNGNGTNLVLVN